MIVDKEKTFVYIKIFITEDIIQCSQERSHITGAGLHVACINNIASLSNTEKIHYQLIVYLLDDPLSSE